MDKKSVRKEKLNLRNRLTYTEVIEKSAVIAFKVISIDQYKKADILLAYCDSNNEVKTESIINDALKNGKKVYCPKVHKETMTMDFYRIYSLKDLSPGYFGIYEPSETSELFFHADENSNSVFMIVPGVSFDINMYRSGYGKGFYDRYLAGKEYIYKCGICFETQITESVYPECNDIRMDCIVSEDEIRHGIN